MLPKIQIERGIENDARIKLDFPESKIIHWLGTKSEAQILILYSTPSQSDAEVGRVDSNDVIQNTIKSRLVGHFKDVPFSLFAIGATLLFRNPNDKFKRTPTSFELEISRPYLTHLLTEELPHIKVVITIDQFANEMCWRHLNVRDMYGKSQLATFNSLLDKTSKTMLSRKNYGEIIGMTAEGDKFFRLMNTPWVTRPEFKTHLDDLLLKFYNKSQPLLFDDIVGSYNAPDLENPVAPLLTFADFRRKMDEDLALLEAERGREPTNLTQFSIEREGATHPFWLLRDVRNDPYVLPSHSDLPKYFYGRSLQYNDYTGHMEIYAVTPWSNHIRVSVSNIGFTFYFRAHPAFADPEGTASDWAGIDQTLYDSHLIWLSKYLNRKLYYFISQLPGCQQDAVVLTADNNRIAARDRYMGQHRAPFVRCDVKHYFLIQKILDQLKKLIRDYKVPSPPSFRTRTEWDKFVFEYNHKFEVFQHQSAEAMFQNKYGYFLSAWYRSDSMHVSCTYTSRQRLLEGHITYRAEDSLGRMEPLDLIPLEGTSLTSNDTPAHVRMSFDIECEGYQKQFPNPLNSPAICICAVSYVHEDKTTLINTEKDPITGKAPDYTVKSGFTYHSFVLGNLNNRTTQRSVEFNGHEFVFSFQTEKDLIESFFYFRKHLFAEYVASHNGKNFDDPFLIKRANILHIPLDGIGYCESQCLRYTEKKFESRALAQRNICHVDGMNGLVMTDTLEIYPREKKMKSHSLNYLSANLVGMTKADMPYPAIGPHWRKNDDTRRDLVDYCVRDSQLVHQLLGKDGWVSHMTELTRASGMVSEDRIYEAGMQEKVFGTVTKVNNAEKMGILFTTSDLKNMFSEKIMKKKDLNKFIDEQQQLLEEKLSIQPKKVQTQLKTYFTVEGTSKSICTSSSSSSSSSSLHSASAAKTERERVNRELKSIRLATNATRRGAEYQGAVVMKTPLGFYYKIPSLCADFEGLYPSNIMAWNLSPENIVFGDEIDLFGISRDDLLEPSPGHLAVNPRTKVECRIFVLKRECRVGLIAKVEEELKRLRDIAKKFYAKHSYKFLQDDVTLNPDYNPRLAAIYLQRSNALKLFGNSIYGALGVGDGILSAPYIAAIVTAVGRDAIMLTRGVSEDTYGAFCAGGDTDSVFMQFPGVPAKEGAESPHPDLEPKWQYLVQGKWYELLEDGKIVRKFLKYRIETPEEAEVFAEQVWLPPINAGWRKPMKLAFEKVMCNLLTVAPKRYACLHCEKGKPPRVSYKGMEVVRRDSLPYLKETLEKISNTFLWLPIRDVSPIDKEKLFSQKKEEIKAYIKERGIKLLRGDLPVEQLVLSKSLSAEYYKNEKQEHLEVVRKMKSRNQVPPGLGSRVPYVYTLLPYGDDGKPRLGSELADDPEWVIKNNMELDYTHYFEQKFIRPVTNVAWYFYRNELAAEAKSVKKRFPKRDDSEVYSKLLLTHIFGDINPSKSIKSKQARFASLLGGKVKKATVNLNNKSSIAAFFNTKGQTLEKLKRHHNTEDPSQLLDIASSSCIEARTKMLDHFKQCRSCLNLQEGVEIICGASDCKHYYPRLTSEGATIKAADTLNLLIQDIEELCA